MFLIALLHVQFKNTNIRTLESTSAFTIDADSGVYKLFENIFILLHLCLN